MTLAIKFVMTLAIKFLEHGRNLGGTGVWGPAPNNVL